MVRAYAIQTRVRKRSGKLHFTKFVPTEILLDALTTKYPLTTTKVCPQIWETMECKEWLSSNHTPGSSVVVAAHPCEFMQCDSLRVAVNHCENATKTREAMLLHENVVNSGVHCTTAKGVDTGRALGAKLKPPDFESYCCLFSRMVSTLRSRAGWIILADYLGRLLHYFRWITS